MPFFSEITMFIQTHTWSIIGVGIIIILIKPLNMFLKYIADQKDYKKSKERKNWP